MCCACIGGEDWPGQRNVRYLAVLAVCILQQRYVRIHRNKIILKGFIFYFAVIKVYVDKFKFAKGNFRFFGWTSCILGD